MTTLFSIFFGIIAAYLALGLMYYAWRWVLGILVALVCVVALVVAWDILPYYQPKSQAQLLEMNHAAAKQQQQEQHWRLARDVYWACWHWKSRGARIPPRIGLRNPGDFDLIVTMDRAIQTRSDLDNLFSKLESWEDDLLGTLKAVIPANDSDADWQAAHTLQYDKPIKGPSSSAKSFYVNQ